MIFSTKRKEDVIKSNYQVTQTHSSVFRSQQLEIHNHYMRYHKVHNLVLMKTKLFHTKKTRNEKNKRRSSWKKLSNVNTIKYPRKWASFSLNKTGSNGVVRIWLRRKPEMEDCPKKNWDQKKSWRLLSFPLKKEVTFSKLTRFFVLTRILIWYWKFESTHRIQIPTQFKTMTNQ